MEKKVRFGLIGCGAIARFHAVSIGQIEGAELIAAFDPHKPGLDRFVAEYGVKGYDTLDALLAEDDVDVKAVTEIYDEIDVKSICEAKMSECLDKGLAAFAKTELGDRAKQLENLACVLMDRKV